MDSVPAGATRMGSRSSTRHGGPAQIFVGRVRKWRKVWSPVASAAASPSASRVVLYKWTPLTPSNGAARDDSMVPEETTPSPTRPVKYVPIAAVIQKNKETKKVAEETEVQAQAQAETEKQEVKETTESMDTDVDAEQPGSKVTEEMAHDPPNAD